MRNYVLTISALISGIVIGAYAAVTVFAIDVDLLGLPYKGTTVELLNDRTIRQGESEVILPAGSKLTYSYTTKSVPIYTLNIVGGFGEIPPESKDSSKVYFFADTP